MSFDTIIKGGTVVDGSGLPKRVADVGIRTASSPTSDGSSGAKRDDRRRRAGRHARHRRRAHALRSAAHLRAVRHVVVLPRRHVGGRRQLRLLDRAVQAGDHDWVTQALRQRRGHDAAGARAGPAVGLGQLPVAAGRARQAARHQRRPSTSATRRCAASSWARPRRSARRRPTRSQHDGTWCARPCAPARRASRRRTRRRTSITEAAGAVAPRRLRGGADAGRRGGRGRCGLDRLPRRHRGAGLRRRRSRPHRRAGARAPGCRSSCRAWATAPAQREMWDDQIGFLTDARAQGAAVYSMLRTQPFMRPFNWQRGTSLFEGCFHWRDVSAHDARASGSPRSRDAGYRPKLAADWDSPNTDSEQGSTLPPPRADAGVRRPSKRTRAPRARAWRSSRKERGVHPADVMCELVVADGLETQFLWNSESAEWIDANGESQREPAHDRRHRRRRRARRPRRRRRVVDVLPALVAARPRALHARGGRAPHHARCRR